MSNISVEQKAKRYMFSHYGDLILSDTPTFNEKGQVYVSNLRSDYPIMIQDDRSPERKLHILKIDHVGAIYIDRDLRVDKEKTTSREACISNLKLFFNLWLKRAEEIIVSASADTLVNVSRFRHFFDPIDSILVSLSDYGEISDVEIEHARVAKRLRKLRLYLELLEGLQIIRRCNKGYVPGNVFVSIRQKKYENKDFDEQNFRNTLLSYVIRERYPTLRDVFKLTILEPTIHIDSCIYLPEMEIEKTVYRTIETIGKDYREYYNRRMPILDLRLNLRRLENAKAIERDGKHYFGNENLLRQMIEMKKSMAPISMGLFTKP